MPAFLLWVSLCPGFQPSSVMAPLMFPGYVLVLSISHGTSTAIELTLWPVAWLLIRLIVLPRPLQYRVSVAGTSGLIRQAMTSSALTLPSPYLAMASLMAFCRASIRLCVGSAGDGWSRRPNTLLEATSTGISWPLMKTVNTTLSVVIGCGGLTGLAP